MCVCLSGSVATCCWPVEANRNCIVSWDGDRRWKCRGNVSQPEPSVYAPQCLIYKDIFLAT